MRDENWKFMWHLQCHVKRTISKACNRETVASKTVKARASEGKTKFSCTAEAHQSTRPGVEPAAKIIHEDQIAGKGQNSILHHNLAHKISDAASNEIFLMQRPRWTRNGRSLRQFHHGDWKRQKQKKEVIKEAQNNNNKVHFASLMDVCHLKSAELEAQFQKCKGSCCASRRYCERRLPEPTQYLLNSAHQHHE